MLTQEKMATANSAYHTQVLEEVDKIPSEYLPSLLKMVRAFREGVTLQTAEESFRQGWQEAVAGQTRPVTELWEGIDAE